MWLNDTSQNFLYYFSLYFKGKSRLFAEKVLHRSISIIKAKIWLFESKMFYIIVAV